MKNSTLAIICPWRSIKKIFNRMQKGSKFYNYILFWGYYIFINTFLGLLHFTTSPLHFFFQPQKTQSTPKAYPELVKIKNHQNKSCSKYYFLLFHIRFNNLRCVLKYHPPRRLVKNDIFYTIFKIQP
jgi:hypothetical protein